MIRPSISKLPLFDDPLSGNSEMMPADSCPVAERSSH